MPAAALTLNSSLSSNNRTWRSCTVPDQRWIEAKAEVVGNHCALFVNPVGSGIGHIAAGERAGDGIWQFGMERAGQPAFATGAHQVHADVARSIDDASGYAAPHRADLATIGQKAQETYKFPHALDLFLDQWTMPFLRQSSAYWFKNSAKIPASSRA